MSRNILPHHTASRFVLVLLLVLATTLSGCSTFKGMFSSFKFGEDDDPKSLPPETLIVQGMDAYNVGNYNDANKNFKIILDEYPFSPQAILAELKSADANYYNKQYPEAKVLYKTFEERHPTNEAIPYVLFQIGMCDYLRTDRLDRDASGPQEAIKSFTRLINAYPQSPYAKEAKARINDSKEFLVNHEYMVAVFYVRTARYDEAKHRLKYLLARYPDSTMAPQAKTLLANLEKGEEPRWGMNQWLPEFMTQAPADRREAKKEAREKAAAEMQAANSANQLPAPPPEAPKE